MRASYAPKNLSILCLWWCAANDTDATVNTFSTIPNRIHAFILALENSMRGNNRNPEISKEDSEDERIYKKKDIDDGEPNRPICNMGLANQLGSCMKEGYDAAHPDNVYIPDLPDAIRAWLPDCMRAAYASHPKQKEIYTARKALANAPVTGTPATPEDIRIFEAFTAPVAKEGLKTFYEKYGHPTSPKDITTVTKAFKDCIDNLHYVKLPKPTMSLETEHAMKETVEALHAHGLTEKALRTFVITYEAQVGAFGKMQQHTLIYLITGTYPVPEIPVPQLSPQERLTSEGSLLEMRGLCPDKLGFLTLGFKIGLRGAMLRNFVGPNGFSRAHREALQYFMRKHNPPLSAQEATQRIHGLSEAQVSSLHLIEAIEANNKEEVCRIIELLLTTSKIKMLDEVYKEYGGNALHWAVARGHMHFVTLLLQAGANANMRAKDSTTPIYIAAQQGFVEAIPVLKAAGADVNTPHLNGATPVYIAAQNGHAAAIIALYTAGANMSTPFSNGLTPLQIAIYKGHSFVVQALRNCGVETMLRLKFLPNAKTDVENAMESKSHAEHQIQSTQTISFSGPTINPINPTIINLTNTVPQAENPLTTTYLDGLLNGDNNLQPNAQVPRLFAGLNSASNAVSTTTLSARRRNVLRAAHTLQSYPSSYTPPVLDLDGTLLDTSLHYHYQAPQNIASRTRVQEEAHENIATPIDFVRTFLDCQHRDSRSPVNMRDFFHNLNATPGNPSQRNTTLPSSNQHFPWVNFSRPLSRNPRLPTLTYIPNDTLENNATSITSTEAKVRAENATTSTSDIAAFAERPVTFLYQAGTTPQMHREKELHEALQTLQPYGFTSVLEKETLIYLVTGEAHSNFPILEPRKRLSPAQAVEEIRNLNFHQLWAIEKLFAFGLTGNLLRTFEGPADFDWHHLQALTYSIQYRRPALSPADAMLRIQRLTDDEARMLWRSEESFEEYIRRDIAPRTRSSNGT